jgi:hypothetical protein
LWREVSNVRDVIFLELSFPENKKMLIIREKSHRLAAPVFVVGYLPPVISPSRFPDAIINCPARWYFRFNPSLRDIEEWRLERGGTVTYEKIRRCCDRFGVPFLHAASRRTTWHLAPRYATHRCHSASRGIVVSFPGDNGY